MKEIVARFMPEEIEISGGSITVKFATAWDQLRAVCGILFLESITVKHRLTVIKKPQVTVTRNFDVLGKASRG